MGYTTTFDGDLSIAPPLQPAHLAYLTALARTRRVRRDASRTALRPDPPRQAVGLPIGADAEYFVSAGGELGQEGGGPLFDPTGATPDQLGILDYDAPPGEQPHVWCCWEPTPDGRSLRVSDGGSHYEYAAWLAYLVERLFGPWKYAVEGLVRYRGEAPSDHGRLVVGDGRVRRLEDGGPGPTGEGRASLELGLRRFADKQFPGALACFERAVALAPRWSEPAWQRGVTLGRLGREDEAFAALDAAIELETDAALGVQRRRTLQELLRSSGRAEQGMARARSLRAASRFDEAIVEYQGYLAAMPAAARRGEEAVSPLTGIGLSHEGQKRYEDALARYDEVIAVAPADATGWTYRAFVLAYHLGRAKDSIEAFANAIELGNDTGMIWNEYGMVLGNTGHHAEARAAFTRAVEDEPESELHWYNLGASHLALGAPKEALPCFQRAARAPDPSLRTAAEDGLRQARSLLAGS